MSFEERAQTPYGCNDPCSSARGGLGIKKKKKITKPKGWSSILGTASRGGELERRDWERKRERVRINVECRSLREYRCLYTCIYNIYKYTYIYYLYGRAHSLGWGNKSQINLTVRIQIYVDGLYIVWAWKKIACACTFSVINPFWATRFFSSRVVRKWRWEGGRARRRLCIQVCFYFLFFKSFVKNIFARTMYLQNNIIRIFINRIGTRHTSQYF